MVSRLEKQREKLASHSIALFQAACKGFLSRQEFKKLKVRQQDPGGGVASWASTVRAGLGAATPHSSHLLFCTSPRGVSLTCGSDPVGVGCARGPARLP